MSLEIQEPITCRPADLIDNELETLESEMATVQGAR